MTAETVKTGFLIPVIHRRSGGGVGGCGDGCPAMSAVPTGGFDGVRNALVLVGHCADHAVVRSSKVASDGVGPTIGKVRDVDITLLRGDQGVQRAWGES